MNKITWGHQMKMSPHLFVYQEDEQMYGHNHVLMAQDGDIQITIEELERMSWKVLDAGRISTSADALIEIASKNGLKLRIIERREKSGNVPSEWSQLPLVRGATGNY